MKISDKTVNEMMTLTT